ncbi:lysylphosphatidylglycerol synthase transmembrane domain-containing protein [Mycolicibacterium sp. CBMA 226]|uniref:lysylphosphatidylglycerol synthase transmembrane domain-containing protein n=1 Tax=Mycolicibacterium sp. CBMA 226 TaxID=2606611 RepID=UPI0012DF33C2|nr:lysylphosphatidylglycerol synthase transmembrane domain-containing protein [Mycolicibacterium sp. CBMA 226]MUL74483.1 flippase-like domain-containing protein [Mycolicibacterium sp. CBMA 226]
MRVDGREVAVSGSLLQPITRRTNDILRLVAATAFLITVVTSSLITRNDWVRLERSVSRIVGVLTPTQSNLVYLAYAIAILALPFVILLSLLVTRQWKLLGPYATAGLLAVLVLSINSNGIAAPNWHFDLSDRLNTVFSQFLDDPRWIALLAAVLTVSGPWQPARLRRWWWTLLLAFVPIHLVVSAIVPARSLLGLAVGWFVGALVVLVSGTPALEVPLVGGVQALARRRFEVSALTVIRPAGAGPLVLSADSADGTRAVVELYGPNQRVGGAMSQLWRKITLRNDETAPLQTSMRRAVEHRALMTIAVGDLDLANTRTIALAALDRGWTMFAHTPASGVPLTTETPVADVWHALDALHHHQISHGDLRASEITVDDRAVVFGGLGSAEYGASDVQLQSDVAQLLVTTTAMYGAQEAVAAAIEQFGEDTVLTASRRLTKSAMPLRLRESLPDSRIVITAARDEVKHQTGADRIQTETITRFTRNQVIQLVLLVALVYVAYPFISTVPTFFSELRSANWWWALLGLTVSALTYVGAAAALWASASESVSFKNLTIMQVANTFAATTTPAGVGGLALSTRFLQKAGLGALRATAAVALQQSVQVLTHVALLIFFSAAAGASADLSHFVPSSTILYLIGGAALGVVGTFFLVPRARHWLGTAVRPRLTEVWADLINLAREPRRLGLIVLGCATTTLGAALALWASVEAFGGSTSFVTVCVVTMIGGTLASAAPTPGGVGAVEAALIGGLAAFGLPAAVAVPSVLLYRVLTCWLPVFIGWPVMRWLTEKDMI